MGSRGFLLLDALLAAALTALAASVTFGVLAAAHSGAGRADRRLAAHGLAAMAIAEARTRYRQVGNPAGEVLAPGFTEYGRELGGRRFSLTLVKEVIASCPGLFRLSVRAVPLDARGDPLPAEAAPLSVLGYDPW